MTLGRQPRERRQWAPEPPVFAFPGMSSSSGRVDAMQLDSVWACVCLLADAVSMMPLHAFALRGGARVPLTDPPLLVSPAAGTTMTDWIYMVMVSLLLRGNAYGHILTWDGLGYPTLIELWDPDTVTVHQDKATGLISYRVGQVTYPASEVWHVRAWRYPGMVMGMSPIAKAAAEPIRTQTAVQGFARGFFEDGAHPSSIITSDQPMPQQIAQQIKDRVMSTWKGREPAVLGNGAKYQPIQVTPEESQFLATQAAGVNQIARIFRVPPELVGGTSGNSMNYANVTQRALDFLTYSVQPWLTRLEAAIFPLLPGQRHVRFDTTVLVRLDALTQAQVDAERLNTGSKTINEVRPSLDLAPVDWGHEPYLPGMATPAAARAIVAEAAQGTDVNDQVADGTSDSPDATAPKVVPAANEGGTNDQAK